MVFGADKAEKKLAERLLEASRFHPLLMDRLARLAGDPALRPRLLEALDALEGTAGFERLPDLFATGASDRDATELVRERVRAWMQAHPADLAGLAEDGVRLAYAGHLAAAFEQLQHRNMTTALAAGARALVYCVQARAWDRLGGFASGVVTGSRDPRFLEALVPHLKAAAEQAPGG
jgi:hypothetical protein